MIPVYCVTTSGLVFDLSYTEIATVNEANVRLLSRQELGTVVDTFDITDFPVSRSELTSATDTFTMTGTSLVGSSVELATVTDTPTVSVDGLLLKPETVTGLDSFVGYKT